MKKQFRVALVGCGAIAGNHITAIREAGQTLCALCDIDPAQAQIKIEKYSPGALPVYTDYIEMLEREKPDAVHICTPHYLHAEMCAAALERNIHVLCEKPLCISPEQLDSLRTAVNKSTAQLGICLQNRYNPNFLRLRELTQNGVQGGCGYVVWKRDEAYYRSGAWRGTWAEEGGGVMINQAIHTLDLLQWTCGMPTHVTAHVSNDHLRGVIEVEDTASARFETADGNTLHFFATTASNTDFPVRLEVRLKSGEVVLATNKLLVVDCLRQDEQNDGDYVGKAVWGNGHQALIADFYNCLAESRPFPIGIAEGEKSVRLIFAMYASNGARVAIPE